jgi:hypothetical protein
MSDQQQAPLHKWAWPPGLIAPGSSARMEPRLRFWPHDRLRTKSASARTMVTPQVGGEDG